MRLSTCEPTQVAAPLINRIQQPTDTAVVASGTSWSLGVGCTGHFASNSLDTLEIHSLCKTDKQANAKTEQRDRDNFENRTQKLSAPIAPRGMLWM